MNSHEKDLRDSLQELTSRSKMRQNKGRTSQSLVVVGKEDDQVLDDVRRILGEIAIHTEKARKAPVSQY